MASAATMHHARAAPCLCLHGKEHEALAHEHVGLPLPAARAKNEGAAARHSLLGSHAKRSARISPFGPLPLPSHLTAWLKSKPPQQTTAPVALHLAMPAPVPAASPCPAAAGCARGAAWGARAASCPANRHTHQRRRLHGGCYAWRPAAAGTGRPSEGGPPRARCQMRACVPRLSCWWAGAAAGAFSSGDAHAPIIKRHGLVMLSQNLHCSLCEVMLSQNLHVLPGSRPCARQCPQESKEGSVREIRQTGEGPSRHYIGVIMAFGHQSQYI